MGHVKGSVVAQGDPRNYTLTPQEKIFCEEYLLCHNKTEAAKRAGYAPKSAMTVGTRLFQRKKVTDYLDELWNERKRKYTVTEQRITEELSKIAYSNFFDMVKDFDGQNFTFRSMNEVPEEMKGAIKSFEITKNGIKIVLYDKTHALELLGKHIGYFEADNRQKQISNVLVYIPDNGRLENTIDIDSEEVK